MQRPRSPKARSISRREFIGLAGAGATVLLATASGCLAQDARQGRRGRRNADREQRGPQHVLTADVPEHPLDAILGRPTDHSVTLSLLAYEPLRATVRLADAQVRSVDLRAGEPVEVMLDSLQADARYRYGVLAEGAAEPLIEGAFHTQRPPGAEFTFAIQADSHLDPNTSPERYELTLANALADEPDFLVDLGDTFMTGKYPAPEDALPQYLAQRWYFGLICRSAPLMFVIGNHDGEEGGRDLTGLRMRTRYFPNPLPDGFYTGNEEPVESIRLPGNYYAWEWGDALFMVLDPYANTHRRSGEDNWRRTLGETQYRWLRETLEASHARHRFVFVHHLLGGPDADGRGGIEAAPYFEWGGSNADGSDGFAENRPGWEEPIHDLLVRTGVSAVFHGHDHFFARQELDGIAYQLLPQPAHRKFGATGNAEAYGYMAGEIVDGSGYLRVHVAPDATTVEFVRSWLPAEERGGRSNREVAFAYTIPAGDDR